MNLVKFYAIGTLIPSVLNLISDIVLLVEHGKSSHTVEILSMFGWIWFPVSGIFIVVFLLQKVSVRLPVVYVVYYLACLLAMALIFSMCPGFIAEGSIPAPLIYIDLLAEVVLCVMSVQLLRHRPATTD